MNDDLMIEFKETTSPESEKITQETFDHVLALHQHWLKDGCPEGDNRRACFRNSSLSSCNVNLDNVDTDKFPSEELPTLIVNDLREVNLSRADMQSVDLIFNDLRGADLSLTDLSYALLIDSDLQGANLQGANLQNAQLGNANLKGADLRGANLENADLLGANLENAKLSGMLFQKANEIALTRNVNLRRANLKRTNLRNADLWGADLSSANLQRAQLVGTNLRDTKLSNAIFREAGIDNANFEGAHLVNNDFTGVKVRHSKKYLFWESMPSSISRFSMIDVNMITGNPMLTQFAGDQVYISQYKKQHKILYWLWLLLSDCGRSLFLLGLWSLLLSCIFATTYQLLGVDHFAFSNFSGEGSPPALSMFYYSVVTFTTLGFGDITPKTSVAMSLVICEVVTGYIFLGMLISVLANKVARRA